jgi:hypothetical protein
MRGLLLSVTLLMGCVQTPYIDLRNPLCIITEGDLNLKVAVGLGTRQWFRHLSSIPDPIMLEAHQSIETPDHEVCLNPPIIVKYAPNLKDACATTRKRAWGYEILVLPACLITSTLAHEIGHILWKMKHIPDRESTMNPFGSSQVTIEDMNRLCEEHIEINCPVYVRCNGTFKYISGCSD